MWFRKNFTLTEHRWVKSGWFTDGSRIATFLAFNKAKVLTNALKIHPGSAKNTYILNIDFAVVYLFVWVRFQLTHTRSTELFYPFILSYFDVNEYFFKTSIVGSVFTKLKRNSFVKAVTYWSILPLIKVSNPRSISFPSHLGLT